MSYTNPLSTGLFSLPDGARLTGVKVSVNGGPPLAVPLLADPFDGLPVTPEHARNAQALCDFLNGLPDGVPEPEPELCTPAQRTRAALAVLLEWARFGAQAEAEACGGYDCLSAEEGAAVQLLDLIEAGAKAAATVRALGLGDVL